MNDSRCRPLSAPAPELEDEKHGRQQPDALVRSGELTGALVLVLVIILYYVRALGAPAHAASERVLLWLAAAYVLTLLGCRYLLPKRVAYRHWRLAILGTHCVAVAIAIWLTGGCYSPFVFLLHLLVLSAVLTMGGPGAVLASILCTVALGIVVTFSAYPVAPFAPLWVHLAGVLTSVWVVAYLGWSMDRRSAEEHARLLEANRTLKAWYDESSLLYAFGRALSAAVSVERLAAEALEQIARFTRADAAMLFLYEAKPEEVVLASAVGLPETPGARVRRQSVGPEAKGLAGRAAFTRESVLVPPGETPPPQDVHGLIPFLAEPLIARGELVGVVELLAQQPVALTDDEVRLLRLLCTDFALSLDNARLADEAEDRARTERLVNRISARVQSTLDVRTVLETAAREVCIAVGASRCLIALSQDDRLMIAHEFCQPGVRTAGVGRPAGPAAACAAFSQGVIVRSDDVAHDRSLPEELRETLLAVDAAAVLAAPLACRGQVLGAISLHECGRPRQWRPADVALLEAVAGQIAIGIENARLYQATRQQSDEIAAKNRELEAFVYTASHDLRAPLVTIQGFASILLKDFADRLGSEGRFYLDRIRVNTTRLERLLDDLLRLSRAGRVAGPFQNVNVGRVVQAVLDELHVPIRERQVTLKTCDHWPQVFCDPDRLAQVYTNLLTNALKFLGPDNAHPCIELGWRDAGEFVELFVRDNGIGIAPEYRDRIFEIFQRLLDLPDAEGSGVGLAIVKRIVEVHGGRIWVESAKGEGATFWFTLPRGQESTP